MHRIFCTEIPAPQSVYTPAPREAEHLFKVFRARPGDEVELLDGRGKKARAEVIPNRQLLIKALEVTPEPAEKLHLCCALPRRQKFDVLLKQAAELGAWSIRLLNCERSVAEGNPRERWEVLLQEACKQSGNTFLPQIYPEESVADALSGLKNEHIDIYYGSVKVIDLAAENLPRQREKAVLIGPEGGFTDGEIAEIENAGGKPLNLGPHILRLETAAVAALAVLRLLTFCCVAGVIFLLSSGCQKGDVKRNPLMIKAEQLRRDGAFEDARRFLRQAVSCHPESPEPYLALGKLCEEELDDKLEALYCYRNFLQFAPESDFRRADTEKIVDSLKKSVAEEASAASFEMAELRKTNQNLQKELLLAKHLILSNQRKIKDLEAQLRAASKRRKRR